MRKLQWPARVSIAQVCVLLSIFTVPAAADPPAAPAAAPAPAIDDRAALARIMERNGGSLMRAEASIRTPLPAEGDAPAAGPPPGSSAAMSFYAVSEPKPKTFKKHDLVTIIAKEQTAASSNGDSKLSKQQDIDMKLNSFIALRPSLDKINSIISGGTNVPEINLQNTRDFTGTGAVDHTDTFSDRVTAEVVDVKPNGTLVLQASKRIKTDEEEQRMILTGICRAADVTADNSVLTTQLFDLDLVQSHTGAINDTIRRGLIPRLLDTFSPF